MPAHHAIELRFVRVNGTSRPLPSATDDILRIVKLGENTVRTVYTEKSSDGSMVDTNHFNYQQLIGYLYRIFLLLTLDDDPFAYVNLSVPGYPIVLLKVEELRKHMQNILEVILSTCCQWPAIGREEAAPATQ